MRYFFPVVPAFRLSQVMSEPEPPPDPPPPASRAVPPLTHRSATGDAYTRRPDVEAEIERMLALDPSQWTAAGLKSETVAHLIRRLWPTGEKTVLGRLLDALAKRTTRIATASARGFSPTITEEIVGAVGLEVMELALAEQTSGQSEFLECSFDLAVQRRALKQAAKRKHLRRTRQFPTHVSEDDGAVTDGAQTVADDGPSPEDLVAEREFRALAPAQISRALAAVSNPDHRLAVSLHHLQGWPITDQDANRQTVSTYFGVCDRTIRNWMRTAFSEMRNALGVSHEQ